MNGIGEFRSFVSNRTPVDSVYLNLLQTTSIHLCSASNEQGRRELAGAAISSIQVQTLYQRWAHAVSPSLTFMLSWNIILSLCFIKRMSQPCLNLHVSIYSSDSIFVFINYGVKYIYKRSIHKKVSLKNTIYFRKYKKTNFLQKDILFYYYYSPLEICLFIFPKIQCIFNRNFLHTLLLHISIYIFNTIIFWKDRGE
jgi:hypothetical protein